MNLGRMSVIGGVLLVASFLGQIGGQADSPRIRLWVPAEVAQERVHVGYFMSGTFGGVGGIAPHKTGEAFYEIEAVYKGKLADRVRVIVYMPGCQFVTFDLEIEGGAFAHPVLHCVPLSSVVLRGTVPAHLLRGNREARVEISYLPGWSHAFYGIRDGMVHPIPLGEAVPDQEGVFHAVLPHLVSDPSFSGWEEPGGFLFRLRDVSTGNLLATLLPEAELRYGSGLGIRSSYPSVVPFRARSD